MQEIAPSIIIEQDCNEAPSESRITRLLLFPLQKEKNGGKLVQLKCFGVVFAMLGFFDSVAHSHLKQVADYYCLFHK